MANKKTLAKRVLGCKTAEELIALIQRELGHGQHIYRGTPEQYKWKKKADISSSIFREYRENPETNDGKGGGIKFDKNRRPVDFEERIISKAKSHFPDSTTSREILTDIRHFGGLTTLIDFSRDLMVALFFACQEKGDEDGQLIILPSKNIMPSDHTYFSAPPSKPNDITKADYTEKKSQNFVEPSKSDYLPKRISLIEPAKTSASGARVIAQKSVFVHTPEGFIRPHLCKLITIKKSLKADILEYLKRFHHIDEATIYHDLHGFIAAQNRFIPALIALEEGTEYLRNGEYEKAINKYNQAIKSKPDFAEAYSGRGTGKAMSNKSKQAMTDYDKAIRLKPDDAKTYYNRGLIKIDLGQFEEAIADFDEAIRLNPNDPIAYNNRAIAKAEVDKPEEAFADFDKAINISPEYAAVYYNRAVTWEELSEYEKADADYAKAKELGFDPSDENDD